MIPIKTLEIQMSSRIRTAIRKAMGFIDVMDIEDPLHEVLRTLESYLYEPMYNQILTTYSEGYISGGNLIRRHMPTGTVLTAAAAPLPAEDPYIAESTEYMIDSIGDSLEESEDEIRAAIRYHIEQGATFAQITSRISSYFGDDNIAAARFARTATNDIYNRAHLDRYEASGVVDGVEYSAHIDRRTSDICRMLDGTIWALGDSGMQIPPMHFNCRSRIKPYFGGIPGKRDFKSEFGSKFVADATKVFDTFRLKYWPPMPRPKAPVIPE